jgi:probable HAF family extracellular repeat protein
MSSPGRFTGFLLCVFGILAAVVLSPVVTQAQNAGYSSTAPGIPTLTVTFAIANVPDALQTVPGGVSNAGAVAGRYEDSSGVFHGYILQGQNLTTLDDPNGTNTDANNLAPESPIRVVGSYAGSTGSSVGFLYEDGEYTDVPGPSDAMASNATGINDAGAIVGFYTDSSGLTHGFLLTGDGYTTLDVPGASATSATGINDKGAIVVFWLDSKGAYESSIYDIKTATYATIDVPNASDSFASDIDNAGDVTYQWLDSGGTSHAAVLHGGIYYDLSKPNIAYAYAGGINNEGEFVGGYRTVSHGPISGFNATAK